MARIVGILLIVGLSLVTGVAAAGDTTVPKKPEIVDPAGDANYLNDQIGWALGTPAAGDVAAASVIPEADILNVWFTNDAKTLSVHMHTAAAAPAPVPLFYLVKAYPTASVLGGEIRCLGIYAAVEEDSSSARLTTECEEGGVEFAEGKVDLIELKDGTGIVKITVPRAASEFFGKKGLVIAPLASTHHTTFRSMGMPVVNLPVIDNTKPGRDYPLK